MRWRRIATLAAPGTCNTCRRHSLKRHMIESGHVPGVTKCRMICDECMAGLPVSTGDPRLGPARIEIPKWRRRQVWSRVQ